MRRRIPWTVVSLMHVLGVVMLLGFIGCDGEGGDDESDTPPVTNVAFVITSAANTGSYSVVDLPSRTIFADIVPGGIHSDAIARFFNGRIYVVNREGQDSIQVIDPVQGYTTPSGAELSVGNGLNPWDIAFVSPEKAYVSRLDSPRLLVINPTTLTVRGEVDLSGFTKPNDLDGRPEAAHMLVLNGLLYVALQHLDSTAGFAKVAPGEVVALNATSDAIVSVIILNGENPFSELQFSPALNRILLSSVGDFGVADGGIEAIDPGTNTVEPGFLLEEATLGGDITHFQIVSVTKGFAVVADANFANALISVNPTTGTRRTTLFGPVPEFLRHFAINTRNELYLAVQDIVNATGGVRIFNATTDAELTTTPLDVGLPPTSVLFLQ